MNKFIPKMTFTGVMMKLTEYILWCEPDADRFSPARAWKTNACFTSSSRTINFTKHRMPQRYHQIHLFFWCDLCTKHISLLLFSIIFAFRSIYSDKWDVNSIKFNRHFDCQYFRNYFMKLFFHSPFSTQYEPEICENFEKN